MRRSLRRDGRGRSRATAAVVRVVSAAAIAALGLYLLESGLGDLRAAVSVGAGAAMLSLAVYELVRPRA